MGPGAFPLQAGPPSSPWVDPTHHLGDNCQSRGQSFLLPWWSSWGAGEAPRSWRSRPRTSGLGQSLSVQPLGLLAPRFTQVRGPARD